MFLLSVLVLFGAANCHVIRNNPKLHYADLSYVGKNLEFSYAAHVYLGTPSQKFSVQLNTEHSHSFVPSVQCSDDFCQNRTKYNSAASSTYKPDGTPFHFVDRNGEYAGLLSNDLAKIGNLTIHNQTFGELLDVESKLNESRIDGIFGLGYNQNNTIFDNLVAQGLIDAPIFSTYLQPNQPKIIFGGSDPDLYYDDLLYVPLVNHGPCWEISLYGVQVGDDIAVEDVGTACFSLTNNFIEGPSDQISKINSLLGAKKYKPINNTYEVDCSKVDSLPEVILFWDCDIYVTLDVEDYITHHIFDSKKVCLSMFSESDDKNNTSNWIFGHPLVRGGYIEYDFGKRRLGISGAR